MKTITILLLLISFQLTAQDLVLKGKIQDENKNPLAFVNIGIVGTSYGTVSDQNGNFEMYYPNNLPMESELKCSFIGYKSFSSKLNSIKSPLNVSLEREMIELAEVIIKPIKIKRKVIGNERESTFMKNFAIPEKPNQNLGAEVGRKFDLDDKKHYLKTLNTCFAYCTFDTVIFRLNIYSIKNGKPDKNLLKENIYLSLINHRKGWKSFNLEPYNLVFDQDVILALEWVYQSKKGKYLGLNITVPAIGAIHYYKFGSQNSWKKFLNMSTSMNLEVEKEY